MEIKVGCVVEGHGERQAVPVLIRRVARAVNPEVVVQAEVLHTPRSRLLKDGELERAIGLMARRVGRQSGILVLVDSDDDRPCELAPALLERAHKAHHDLLIAVVLAKREFESWFLAAAKSLRGYRGLPVDLEAPPDPEGVRGAKEWLCQARRDGHQYSPTVDQAALTEVFSFDEARQTSSFDKCYREVARLVLELGNRRQPLD
jgi:hypothetical protein